jgi:hypothetical protein
MIIHCIPCESFVVWCSSCGAVLCVWYIIII